MWTPVVRLLFLENKAIYGSPGQAECGDLNEPQLGAIGRMVHYGLRRPE